MEITGGPDVPFHPGRPVSAFLAYFQLLAHFLSFKSQYKTYAKVTH